MKSFLSGAPLPKLILGPPLPSASDLSRGEEDFETGAGTREYGYHSVEGNVIK